MSANDKTLDRRSSWLRGFLAWIPSSSYASNVSKFGNNFDDSSAGSVTSEALWTGTVELFNTALAEFLSEPGNQRQALNKALNERLFGSLVLESLGCR